MNSPKLSVPCLVLLSCLLLASSFAGAQTPNRPASKEVDKASAYYHFTLGHLYSELAAAYGNRGEYLGKAIENYKLAMKADPNASFLAEELSDLYFQAGRLKEAVTDAEEALKLNPSDVNARRILGRMYTRMIGDREQGKVNQEMLKKAIEQYQKITELQPEDTDSLLTLGRLQKVAQNSVEAEKAYKKILDIDPANEDALTGLAIVYADLGDSKRAAELLERVTTKTPSVRTLMALAAQYEQLRDYALAAETLKKTLELAPGNTDAMKALAQNLLLAENVDEALKVYTELAAADKKDATAQLRLSQIYREKRDFDKARQAAKAALEIEPDSLETRYNEITLLEAEGKSAEATTALKNLLTSTAKKNYSAGERSNRIVLLERLGLMYRNNEQYTEAVETFRQVAELDPNLGGRTAAQIADTYRIAKDYTKALEEANSATKKHPEDRVLRAVRASLLAETGKTDEAAAELKSLLDGKNDRETYITLAQVYEKAKNYSEMSKAVDAAEKLSESKEDKESIAFMRGAMFEKMKNYDAAESEFRKVLQFNPKNASALNYLGYMLADRNVRLSDALQMIKQAVELDPNNGAYLDSLGWVYFRIGDFDQAENYLRRAIERFSKDPTVHDHLGDVYLRQGRTKEAIAQWERSLEEWRHASPSESDPTEIAKVQKKLEGARVRLAKETGGPASKQQ
jgi:tetratricopeptide (TPR) repeat protein